MSRLQFCCFRGVPREMRLQKCMPPPYKIVCKTKDLRKQVFCFIDLKPVSVFMLFSKNRVPWGFPTKNRAFHWQNERKRRNVPFPVNCPFLSFVPASIIKISENAEFAHRQFRKRNFTGW